MESSSAERAATNRLRRRNITRDAQRAAQYRRRIKEIAEKAETADPSQFAVLRLQLDCYRHLHDKVEADKKCIEHAKGTGFFEALSQAVRNEARTLPSTAKTIQ